MEIGECLTYLLELDASMKWLNRAPFALYGDPSIGIYTCKSQTSLTQHAAKGAAGQYFLHTYAHSGRTQASVLFRFSPVQKGNAKLSIYSASGALVNTICLSQGTCSAQWLPGNNNAATFASGIYIATLTRETKEGAQFVSCAKVVVR
jgi:flagellar hook assembly protein FlgD